MRLLLDSHVLIWWMVDDRALGSRARAAITEADQVLVSAVTPWELGIERAIGKIEFPHDLATTVGELGFEPLPIRIEHAELAPALPPHHRDPFDRMLVAQATVERLTLMTADAALEPYGIELLDARR